jgi:chromosome segregation ATPase
MSIERVLRRIGGDEANALADAWHDHERELNGRLTALSTQLTNSAAELRAEIDKATSRATLGLSLAGLTLAGLIAISYYVGLELGGLKAQVVNVERRMERVENRLEQVEDRLGRVEIRLDGLDAILRAIDERTRRIEANQRASTELGPSFTEGDEGWRRFEEAVLAAYADRSLSEEKRRELVASHYPRMSPEKVALIAKLRAPDPADPAALLDPAEERARLLAEVLGLTGAQLEQARARPADPPPDPSRRG